MKTVKPSTPNQNYKINQEMMNFVIKMGRFYESYGLQRIGGQIFGLLVILDSPLTTEDIQNILQISRASISTNLKFILKSGVEEIRYPGNRKTYYKFTDYSGIKGYKDRHAINQFFGELLGECMIAMKKNKIKISDLEILKKTVELENKLIMDFLINSKRKRKLN